MAANMQTKVLKNMSSTSTTLTNSSNDKNPALVKQQKNHHNLAMENSSANNISVTSKSEPLTTTRMVVITAKANSSAPAVLSSATKLLVNDVLAKNQTGAQNSDSGSSTKTWMDFSDMFSSSFESLSKLCNCTVLANQQHAKPVDDNKVSNPSNVITSGSEIPGDLLKLLAIKWTSNDLTNTKYENIETVSSEHSTQSIPSAFTRMVSSISSLTDRLEYSSADKLELRFAIANASNFSEFVRLYSNNGKHDNSPNKAVPTLPQIIKIAELLFKDYQQSVLQLSNA